MNRQENLLNHLSEECNEVGQRVSKALRFGLTEVQAGQSLNNAERILEELHDLISVAYILQESGAIGDINPTPAQINRKRQKIEKYLAYSRQCGTLTDETDYQRGYDAGVSDGLDSAAEDAAGASM